jgi:hypothetical protein
MSDPEIITEADVDSEGPIAGVALAGPAHALSDHQPAK